MLKFKYTKYRNFFATGNAFTRVDLDRSKSTIIMGINGSGKSTFCESLCYGLFGRPLREINKPLLVNSIINKNMVVEVGFEVDGRTYKIIRGMKPNRFEIYKDGEMINQADKSVDYQKYLETEVLRMNFKSFKQIVVLGSAGYTPFMELKADVRRVVSEDILDIRVFSTMLALLRKEVEETKDQLRDIASSLSSNKQAMEIHQRHLDAKRDDYTSVVDGIAANIVTYNEKIKAIAQVIVDLYTRHSALAAALTDKDKIGSVFQQIQGIERSIEDRIFQYKKQVTFYTSNNSCPTCNQDIDDKFKDTVVCEHTNQINTLEAGIDEVSAKKEALEQQLLEFDRINDQLNQIMFEIKTNNSEIELIQRHISGLQNQLVDLERAHNEQTDQSAVSALTRAIENDTAIRMMLNNTREVQEYALVMLKDSGIKSKVIKKYIPVINSLINKYLVALGSPVTFELNEQFQETIRTAHKETFVYNSFSQGERMRIDIAILMAWRDVAKMRNSMSTNLLIMDEIFDSSLDDSGTDDLIKILEEVTGDTNIFVISHNQVLFDKFRSAITFKKDGNFSKIVQDGVE